MGSQNADVVVIGAGLSGVRCTELLTSAGVSCLLLESRDRIGGRTLSYSLSGVCAPGERLDKGAAWIGPTQVLVSDLVQELGLETIPQWISGRNIMVTAKGRIEWTGDIPWTLPGGVGALLELQGTLWKLDWMAANIVDVEKPPLGFDGVSVGDWVRQNVRYPAVADTVRAAVMAVFVEDPDLISLSWFLTYVRSAGGVEALTDSRGGAQDSRVAKGTLSCSERLAERLPKGTVALNAQVSHVLKDSAGRFAVTCSDGRVFTGKQVVVAASPEARSHIDFSAVGGTVGKALGQGCVGCRCIKASIGYAKPFWREKGFTGMAVYPNPDPVGYIFDNCTLSGGAALVMFFCAGGEKIADSEVKRKATAVQVLTGLFGEEAREVVAYG
eukprot:Hpha_TRINITY_DN9226_c0_g2::TRINITY_DN9226_c0_g2_i1::g.28608::m.28608/K00274/MAO, aofH; monoamine oxidase